MSEYLPLIYSYLRKYQEDPKSRVFAPLAEAYRKAGMFDEAIEVAREGLKIHPHFSGGRVALARSLFDKKRYEEVAEELETVVRDAPDNLVAQRLLAESCLMLGRLAEALNAFKMLLYFTPEDSETTKIVTELEAQAYAKGAIVLRTDPQSEGVSQPEWSPEVRRDRWISRIERLQSLLQRVERYRCS